VLNDSEEEKLERRRLIYIKEDYIEGYKSKGKRRRTFTTS
jgi:hypothetical protein